MPFKPPKLIDAHAHLNSKDFSSDYEDVAYRMLEKDIWAIMPGFQVPTSKKAIEIAQQFGSGLFAAVGYHPIHVDKFKEKGREMDEAVAKIRELAGEPRVVAIGEVGLDYYHMPKDEGVRDRIKALQHDLLWKFLEMSQETRLPLILHCRDAYDDLIDRLQEFDRESRGFDTRGVIHSFMGSWEQAKRFLNLDFAIGFNGIITFGNVQDELVEVVRRVPLEKILVETDSPWLTPEPRRGRRKNEPAFVEYVAKRVAEIKGISYDEVAAATTENAARLFKLDQVT